MKELDLVLDEKSRNTLESIRLINEIQSELPSLQFERIFDIVSLNPDLSKRDLISVLKSKRNRYPLTLVQASPK